MAAGGTLSDRHDWYTFTPLLTTLKKCPGCGRQVVERGATYCDICKNIQGDVDGNIIVIDKIPFAEF